MNGLLYQIKAKASRRQGVALVTTLVMLSVVTLMAVVFLATTRRERVRTTLTEEQDAAKYLADGAIARVQAQIAANMMASQNPIAGGLMVSTNYMGGKGFYDPALGSSPTNVGYTRGHAFGPLLSGTDYLRALTNMQYDARPPVFVQTNAQGAMDFRFWLDFNRNRRFETNGLMIARDVNNRPAGLAHLTGDPEWIGVLEYPHLPHSETNRFIGRYAYMVLPTGRSLDLNTIHNHTRRQSSDDLSRPADVGYARGQGVGPWEMNLAAFLRDLNTNLWAWPRATYVFNTSSRTYSGLAFEDARSILSYRYATNRLTLAPVDRIFAQSSLPRLRMDVVDWYGDSTPGLSAMGSPYWPETDDFSRPWPGSINTNIFTDVQELFTRTAPHFANTLRTDRTSTYDSYTFYRMLEQIGVDSAPSLTWYNPYLPGKTFSKVHLNYTNIADTIPTNLVEHTLNEYSTSIPLSPQTNLFMQLADAFIKASIQNAVVTVTNTSGRTNLHTNYFIGETLVRPDIGITNIQLFHNGRLGGSTGSTNLTANSDYWGFPTNYFNTNREYSQTVHRLLQVAANIYDNRTNDGTVFPAYPSVFRPVFSKTPTNVVITGFRRELTSGFMSSNAWVDLEFWGRSDTPTTVTNITANVYGVPAIIGAKKGYPAFNEFMIQTMMSVTRKIELQKATIDPNSALVLTNQSHLMSISNRFGLEAWNSYTNDYERPFILRATNFYSMALYNFPGTTSNGVGQTTVSNLMLFTNGVFTAQIARNGGTGTNSWRGATNIPNVNPDSFIIPIFTNRIFLTNSYYVGHRQPFLWQATNKNQFVLDGTFETPRIHLHITNRLVYVMLDAQSGRVLDYINLDRLTNFVDIGQMITARSNVAGGLSLGGGIGAGAGGVVAEDDFWETNRLAGSNLPEGVRLQLEKSLDDEGVPDHLWRNFNVQTGDRERSVDLFRLFMGEPPKYDRSLDRVPPGIRHQTPYTPTRRILYTSSWQVNDPLVRTLMQDLYDPIYSAFNITNFIPIMPPNAVGADDPHHNIGKLNKRYRPWGGNPDTTFQADPLAASPMVKDPLIFRSDDWQFPIDDPTVSTNRSFRFPTVGWLGRVHRGTPWQTIYMKSDWVDMKLWTNRWGASYGTHPSFDYPLFDTVTTAPHENATRGLLGVNQTNLAAWSAVLSGLTVWSNSVPDGALPSEPRKRPLQFTPVTIDPAVSVPAIVDSINQARQNWVTTVASNKVTNVFFNSGSILAARGLSDASPFLNTNLVQVRNGITDAVYEGIPQQIMSLVQQEQPRFTVYAFGQTLRPAPRSLVTDGDFYNLCTNYQVSGEFAVKSILRFEGELNNPANPLRSVVESYEVLPPE